MKLFFFQHWAKRTGNKNINLKTAKGINISTVGVDVGDWMYEKKIRGQSSYGPVVFRTWDFGGQVNYVNYQFVNILNCSLIFFFFCALNLIIFNFSIRCKKKNSNYYCCRIQN